MAQDEGSKLFFRSIQRLPMLVVGFEGVEEFTVEGDQVTICRLTPVETSKERPQPGSLELTLSSWRPANRKHFYAFDVLQRFVDDSIEDRSDDRLGFVGTWKGQEGEFSQIPKWLHQYVQEVQDSFASIFRNIVNLVRWRLDVSGTPLLRSRSAKVQWSRNACDWYVAPYLQELSLERLGVATFTPDLKTQVIRLMQANENLEPLGHELLREAYSLAQSNPRSALLIGMAAVETRLKEFLEEQSSIVKWFVDHPPFPKTINLLRGLLPEVASVPPLIKGQTHVPANVLEHLEKAIRVRNGIAHKRRYELSEAKLSGYLEVASDVIWLLDYYDGHEWAGRYLSVSARYGNPYIEQGRVTWPRWLD